MNITEIRQKYPQYNDISDGDLAIGLHEKHYSDIPFKEFSGKIGFDISNVGGGAVESALQGVTFGFSDELQSGIEAGVSGVKNIFSGETPNFGENYDNHQRLRQYALDDFKKHNSTAALAGEVAGAIGSGGVGAVKLAKHIPKATSKLGNFLTKTAALSAGGAVGGGVAGAGTAEQGEKLEGAKDGAVIGSVAGPVVGGAVNTVGRVAGAIKGALKPSTVDDQVSKALVADGLDQSSAISRLDELGADGVIADLGPNSRALADTAATFQGQAKNTVNEALDSRQAGRNPRVVEATKRELGDSDEFFLEIDKNIAGRAEKAKPLYEKAYQQDIRLTDEIKRVFETPSGQKALAKAQKLAADDGIKSLAFDDEVIPTQLVDYFKRSLDDQISKLQRKGGGNEARILANIKSALLKEVDSQNPHYPKARQSFAGDIALTDAAEKGLKFLNQDAHFSRKMLGAMSDAEKEFYFKGASKAIRDKILSAQDGADAYRRIFGNDLMREKIKAIMPSEEAFDRFAKTMKQESEFAQTRSRVQGNSLTTERLANAQDFGDAAGVAGSAASGNIGSAVIGVVNAALKRKGVRNEQRAEEIAQFLINGTPDDLARLKGLAKNMRGDQLTTVQNAIGIAASAKAGSN